MFSILCTVKLCDTEMIENSARIRLAPPCSARLSSTVHLALGKSEVVGLTGSTKEFRAHKELKDAEGLFVAIDSKDLEEETLFRKDIQRTPLEA
jgi:hypothetical protein